VGVEILEGEDGLLAEEDLSIGQTNITVNQLMLPLHVLLELIHAHRRDVRAHRADVIPIFFHSHIEFRVLKVCIEGVDKEERGGVEGFIGA